MLPNPLYDYAILDRICHSNKEFERQLLGIFVETVPESLQNLKNAWLKRDFPTLLFFAHKLKTTIESLKIEALKEVIKKLENLADQKKDSQETEEAVFQVYNTLSALLEEFKAKLA
jgi:HPt (histidine-containing phosphotransfer) domain-containing protein